MAAAALASCDASGADLADGRYLNDLDARGVPTGATNGAPPELGHAICTDLDAGATAAGKLGQVDGLQLGHSDQFTRPQAEVIVYWAVTELCPQHAAELPDSWRDGD